MAYNGRMSMARSSQPSSGQSRGRREEEGDAFMTLVSRVEHLRPFPTSAQLTDERLARQRDRRLHQRHWNQFQRARSTETECATDTEGV